MRNRDDFPGGKMRVLLFGILLLAGGLRADSSWMENSGAQFSLGFGGAFVVGSVSDMCHKEAHDLPVEPLLGDLNGVVDRLTIHAGWGALTAICVEWFRCNHVGDTQFSWDAIRWGALGGLTSVTVRF
jgi:hypothetical protein